MDLHNIEEILKKLKDNKIDDAINLLMDEREKTIVDKNEHNRQEILKFLEKYILESNLPCLYLIDNNLSFTNRVSLFRLNDYKELFEKINTGNNSLLTQEIDSYRFDKIINNCKQQLGNEAVSVEYERRDNRQRIITYEGGVFRQSFDMNQIEYIECFLGESADYYISANNPIAFVKSNKGFAYTLGLKRK